MLPWVCGLATEGGRRCYHGGDALLQAAGHGWAALLPRVGGAATTSGRRCFGLPSPDGEQDPHGDGDGDNPSEDVQGCCCRASSELDGGAATGPRWSWRWTRSPWRRRPDPRWSWRRTRSPWRRRWCQGAKGREGMRIAYFSRLLLVPSHLWPRRTRGGRGRRGIRSTDPPGDAQRSPFIN